MMAYNNRQSLDGSHNLC